MERKEAIKQQLVEYGKAMVRDRLVRGTSGNISVLDRTAGHVFITPTGTDYERLVADQVAVITLTGQRVEGLVPSSETSMHLGIYSSREDVMAVVHTHSMYATAFAVHGMDIPAVHYMVTMLGGDKIPVTPHYELYGSRELAASTVDTLSTKYHAALLRKHGVIAIGGTLSEAYRRAVIVEEMAELYHHVKALGEPELLSPEEIDEVVKKSVNYGQLNE